MSLSVEQMEFLQSRGLSLADVIEFAKMCQKPARSANAERQARFRQRRRETAEPVTESVTKPVTDNVTRNVTPSLSLPLSPQTPLTPTHTHPDNIPRARKALPAKPDGVLDQTWTDFLDLRKRKRAPLTETAMAGIAREAQKAGWTMEAALAKCLARGWQGFEADWVKTESPPITANGAPDPMMRAILAHRAKKSETLANV